MSDQPTQPDQFDYLDEDPAGDGQSATYVAPEEPMGSHSFGTTVAEQRAGETFQQRDKHTNRDVFEREPTDIDLNQPVGRLVQPGDEDVDVIDDEAATVAWSESDDGDLSAEEQAMHRTDNP